jgi:hypothetical protein
MPRYDVEIRAIGENVERLAGEDVRKRVMEGSEQITDSSSPAEVAMWVKGAMERLDNLVDEQTRSQAMLNCGYRCIAAHKSVTTKMRARRAQYQTLDEFLQAEERNPSRGARLTREGSIVYQFYTPRSMARPVRCYCPLLRGLPNDETVSLTYCQCSRGFVEKVWEKVLGRPVWVELVESCAAGAPECKFAIHLETTDR